MSHSSSKGTVTSLTPRRKTNLHPVHRHLGMSWASSTLPKSVKNKAHNRNYSSLFSKSAYSTARPRQQRALVTSTLLNIPARWPNHTSSPRGCPGKLPCSTAAPSGSHGRGSSWQGTDGKLLLHQLSPISIYWNLHAPCSLPSTAEEPVPFL